MQLNENGSFHPTGSIPSKYIHCSTLLEHSKSAWSYPSALRRHCHAFETLLFSRCN